MDSETWMNANKAVELGFAEAIEKLDREILLDALYELEESEMDMIIKMFLSDEILNGEEYGKIVGQSRKEVSKKKKKTLDFLREFMLENGGKMSDF